MPINPNVLADIEQERQWQDEKWGIQDHPPAIWLAILTEEIGETAKEVLRRTFDNAHPQDLVTELIQVAAVAIQWLEAIEREES